MFPGIPSGEEGGGCLQVGAGVSVGKAIFLEISLEGRGGGLFTSWHRFAREKNPGILCGGGRGERGKFLEVTLNGVRVSVRILFKEYEFPTMFSSLAMEIYHHLEHHKIEGAIHMFHALPFFVAERSKSRARH